MEIIAGIAMAFNLLIILHKARKMDIINAILDLVLLIVILILTSGSVAGIEIGMVASLVVSIYLFTNPIKPSDKMQKEAKVLKNLFKEINNEHT
jgi:Ca2+/Na+ antiporter